MYWDDVDIPDVRFKNPPAEGQWGDKEHINQIKVRFNGEVRLFTVADQTVEQIMDEYKKSFVDFQQKTNKKYIAVANDVKNSKLKIPLDKTSKISDLFIKGLNDIQIESAYNEKGELKYPELPQYSESPKYFPEKPKIVSQIQPEVISIKLIYQSINKEPNKTVVVSISSSQTILDLKKKAKDSFGIASLSQILLEDVFCGLLKNQSFIYEEKLSNGSQIYVRIIQSKCCFPSQTRIKVVQVHQNTEIITQKRISQIEIGDFIVSYNEKGHFLKDQVTFVKKLKSNTLMEISTQNGSSVRSAVGDLYLTSQGWKKQSVIGNSNLDSEILKTKLTQKDQLVFFSCQNKSLESTKTQNTKISKIQIFEQENPTELYHLSIQKNHTFIVNDFIVHNMQIQVHHSKTQKIYKIDASPSDLIQNIKTKVAEQIGLSSEEFHLLFAQKSLDQNKSLNDYNIGKGDKLQINLKFKKIKSQIIQVVEKEKWLIIKDKVKQYNLKYSVHKNKTVWQFMREIRKDSSPKYLSLLHGNMFLRPIDKISEVQKNPNFEESVEIHCVLVESGQRKLFYEQILKDDYLKIMQKYKDPNNKTDLINKFRNPNFNRVLIDQLFRFDPTNEEYLEAQSLAQVRQTILGLMTVQKYQNSSSQYSVLTQSKKQQPKDIFEYDLYKRNAYNGFHKRYQTGQALYFREFLQTKKKNYKEIINSKPTKETIFFVRGLSAVNLGPLSQTQPEVQVLFLPFTYFTVDHVIVDNKENPSLEYIFLTQMQTLYNYSKPFLLWVDDLPNNISNKNIQNQVLRSRPDTEIMKLVSTRQAQNWMNQFAWLFNWHDIKFKIISDMTRYEVSHKSGVCAIDQLKNGEYLKIEEKLGAAIDLIQTSCDHLGYTTLTTIFCMNKENAINRMKNRKLQRGLHYHQIIIDLKTLWENINAFLTNDKTKPIKTSK